MKLLPILIGALSILSTAETLTIDWRKSEPDNILVPRGKGKGKTSSSSSRRPGGSSSNERGRADSPGYVDRLAREPKWSSYETSVREEPSRSRGGGNPRDGFTGLSIDRTSTRPRIYQDYGNRMPEHATSVDYQKDNREANGLSRERSYWPRSSNGRNDNRAAALKHTRPMAGTVRDEKPLNSWEYNRVQEPATVVRTSRVESQGEAPMARRGGMMSRELNIPLEPRNTMSYTPPLSDRARPLKGRNLPGYAPPVYETSSRTPRRSSRRLVRRDAFDEMTADEAADSTASQENTNEADYQVLVDAWEASLTNATAIVLPIVKDMVARSNSTLVYETALAIMVLADPTLDVQGPFFHGLHAFDEIEDEMYESLINNTSLTNITDATDGTPKSYNLTDLPAHVVNNKTLYDGWMATLSAHALVIDLYMNAWENATAQMNQTGLDAYQTSLGNALNTNDTSLYPAGWADVDKDGVDEGGDAAFLLEFLDQHSNVTVVK